MRSTSGICFEARCRPCCGGNGDGGRGVGGDGGVDSGGGGDGAGDSCLPESSPSNTSGDTVIVFGNCKILSKMYSLPYDCMYLSYDMYCTWLVHINSIQLIHF